MDKLVSWSKNADPGVRYFSGLATCAATFTLPPDAKAAGQRCILQLGKVCDVAEVTLNGRKVGVVWIAPFELDGTGDCAAGAAGATAGDCEPDGRGGVGVRVQLRFCNYER